MHISLSLKNLLPLLALVLGVAALVVPRHIHFIVAIFLIAFAVFGFGLIR
jgi:hypothetical protein